MAFLPSLLSLITYLPQERLTPNGFIYLLSYY